MWGTAISPSAGKPRRWRARQHHGIPRTGLKTESLHFHRSVFALMSWSKTNQQIADLTPRRRRIERARERKTTGSFFFSCLEREFQESWETSYLIVSSHLLLFLFGSVLRVGDRCIHTDKLYRDFYHPTCAVSLTANNRKNGIYFKRCWSG